MIKRWLDAYWSKKLSAYDCKFSSGISSLSKQANITIEEHVKLSKVNIKSKALSIGAFTYLRSGCELYEVNKIGRFCSIGNNVVIGLERHKHPTQWLTTSLFTKALEEKHESLKDVFPVIIGNDCWIGRNVIIMSGVQIGDGAIIAAGAIVAENVAPYAIYAGVPAKRIKYRFSADLISQIIQSKWWQYANEELGSLPMWHPKACIEMLASVKKSDIKQYKTIVMTSKGVKEVI